RLVPPPHCRTRLRHDRLRRTLLDGPEAGALIDNAVTPRAAPTPSAPCYPNRGCLPAIVKPVFCLGYPTSSWSLSPSRPPTRPGPSSTFPASSSSSSSARPSFSASP